MGNRTAKSAFKGLLLHSAAPHVKSVCALLCKISDGILLNFQSIKIIMNYVKVFQISYDQLFRKALVFCPCLVQAVEALPSSPTPKALRKPEHL